MKILIVKIGAIGDVIMARSMALAAKKLDPKAKVTWMCGRSLRELVAALEGVDEVVAVPDRWLLRGNILQKLAALMYAWWKMGGRTFDLIATGHSDWRYGLLSLTAVTGARRSFNQSPLKPGRFHGDEYLRLVLGFGGPAARRALAGRPPVLKLSRSLESRLPGSRGSRVLLFPGGARNLLRDDGLRRWPLEHYVELAKILISKGLDPVVGGARGDVWILPAFKEIKVTNLVGATGLTQAAALCQACGLVITHDSGPMHLGIWAGTRVIALFGPTDPAEKVVAGSEVKVLWGGAREKCRPCYDGKNYAACLDPACLRGISPKQVAKTAMAMLKGKTR